MKEKHEMGASPVRADETGSNPLARRLARAIGLACTVGVLLPGCSATDGSAEATTDSVMSAAQVAALADGAVDYDEYHEGARRHIACLAAAGYEVLMEEETFDLVNFGTPEEAVLSGVDEECYQLEWKAVDMAWQEAHWETSETAFLMAECLESNGLPVPGTVAEKDAALKAAGIALEDCM
jgi:hypothetical protein